MGESISAVFGEIGDNDFLKAVQLILSTVQTDFNWSNFTFSQVLK